jgi:hypothetical protein
LTAFSPRPYIAAFVLRILLSLAAIFALTALGIFLIRRSSLRP